MPITLAGGGTLREASDLAEPIHHPNSPIEDPTASELPYADRHVVVDWTIESYHVLGKLGEGGFGEVFLAEQKAPVRRRVALKIIKLGMDSKSIVARFHAEQQALALMDHPNVAKVFDAGVTSNGRPFFAMDLVRGMPITEHCDRHKLSIHRRIHLFMAVCDAIQHAHQKGVIHRDIKPSNILVAIEGARAVVKVIDFGVAKAINARLTEQTIYTQQGQLIGTPEYMSPEQAEMSIQDVDTRSDIYSLGVLLYELLTGTLPFERRALRSAGLAEIQRIIRDVEPPRPSTRLGLLDSHDSRRSAEIVATRRLDAHALAREIRGDLDWIVMKCIEKDRTRRYETANALSMDLHRHLSHEPVLAGPPGAGYRVRKFARRNRGALAASSVVIAVVLLGFAVSVWQAVRATHAESRAATSLAEAITAREAEATQRVAAESARAIADEQAAEAERQAAIATAINRFLTEDLFGSVDMNVAKGRDLTVREVFDRAAAQLDNEFSEQPLVESALRETFGRVYSSLGLFERARTEFARGLALREQALGADALPVADLLENYAWSYRTSGGEKAAKGKALMARVVAIRTRALGLDHPLTLRARGDIAMFDAMASGENASGLDPLTLAALVVARGMNESPAKLKTHLERAILDITRAWKTGDRKKAMAMIEKEVAPVRNNPFFRERIAVSLSGYAIRMMNEKRFDIAEPLALYAVTVAYEIHGRMHENTVFAESTVGNLYFARGEYELALPSYERALAIAIDAGGESHPFVAGLRHNLGKTLERVGQPDRAEAVYRSTLADIPEDSQPLAMVRIAIQSTLGSLLMSRGEIDEGERLLRRAIDDAAQYQGDRPRLRVEACLRLARRLTERGRSEEAAALLDLAGGVLAAEPEDELLTLREEHRELQRTVHDQTAPHRSHAMDDEATG